MHGDQSLRAEGRDDEPCPGRAGRGLPGPSAACAAVPPRQTTTFGCTMRISASSQGRHAATSRGEGVLCRRRLPEGTHLKCFTALVT